MKMEVQAHLEITPKMMAQAFWSMGSEQQAQFFEELSNEINGDTYHANCQWFYLGDDLRKNDKARSMLMDIAAPLYLEVLRATGEQI
jgi:hypothetical protein